MNLTSQKITNIAFYKFVEIVDPEALRLELTVLCRDLKLKGSILLASEGINGMLSGVSESVAAFEKALTVEPAKAHSEVLNKVAVSGLNVNGRFTDIIFKRSESEFIPFKRLLIKVKKEILTLRAPGVDPARKTGAYVKPQELEEWLDRGEEIVLLDTRNGFEVEYGTFKNAMDPKIKSFGQFPKYVQERLDLPKDKKIVTFCTGGIRCEKATAVMLEAGFKNVYQLEGGILEYFARTPARHWQGTCFVFDEREAVDTKLQPKRRCFRV